MDSLYAVPGLRKAILLLQNIIFNLFYSRRFGNRMSIFGFPVVVLSKNSKISCGKNFVLISSSYFSEPGVNHPVVLRTVSSEASITIGNNVGLSGGGVVAAKSIFIGNDVMLGSNVFITDTDFHPLEPENRRFSHQNVGTAPVIIEDNVFIGMNTIVLKGVTIGCNSVIGAGSVVTKSIPSNCVAAGSPARVLKQL